MSDIFISYASADRPKARALAKSLKQQGWTVWWDRKITPGQSFDNVLEAALNAAKCVVVLWSHASCSSDWVKNEAAEGKRRGILVPAFIEDISPPFEFRRIQAANLVDWQKQLPGNELDQFLEAIEGVLGAEGSFEKPPDRPPPQKDTIDISRWKIWGRFVLFTFLMVLSLMGLFKALYPQTPVTEGLMPIIILSIITGIGLNFCWKRWRQVKEKK